jgi:hypothetical protein
VGLGAKRTLIGSLINLPEKRTAIYGLGNG